MMRANCSCWLIYIPNTSLLQLYVLSSTLKRVRLVDFFHCFQASRNFLVSTSHYTALALFCVPVAILPNLICFGTYIDDYNDSNSTGSVTTLTYCTVQAHNFHIKEQKLSIMMGCKKTARRRKKKNITCSNLRKVYWQKCFR
jgi:hypothetical protein